MKNIGSEQIAASPSVRMAAIRCAAVLLALILTVFCLPNEYIYNVSATNPTTSGTDAAPTGGEGQFGPADFTRVPMVPANVEIPYFYQEVVNISGMYIFTLPDGTVYKRIYGAINDVYGWYEPQGAQNNIYPDAQPINVQEDIEMYTQAVREAAAQGELIQDFPGILPPEEGVTGIDSIQGMSIRDLFVYCAGATAVLCFVISVAGSAVRKKKERGNIRGKL